jgi:putative transposase
MLTKDRRGEYDLWQKRYWEHTIRDDRDFEAHVNYVHINPVKHEYVKQAIEWPHSTLHRYVGNGALSAHCRRIGVVARKKGCSVSGKGDVRIG